MLELFILEPPSNIAQGGLARSNDLIGEYPFRKGIVQVARLTINSDFTSYAS